MKKYLIIFMLLSATAIADPLSPTAEKQKFEKGDVLIFHQHEETTGRRTLPRPQMRIMSESIYFMPKKVECTYINKYKWDCEGALPVEFKWKKMDVECEGFEYPHDPYILANSCQFQFSIEKRPTLLKKIMTIIAIIVVCQFLPYWIPPLVALCILIARGFSSGRRGRRRGGRRGGTKRTRNMRCARGIAGSKRR